MKRTENGKEIGSERDHTLNIKKFLIANTKLNSSLYGKWRAIDKFSKRVDMISWCFKNLTLMTAAEEFEEVRVFILGRIGSAFL